MSSISTNVSGLQAAMLRLDVAASNIANQNTTGPLLDANGTTTAYSARAVQQSPDPSGGVMAKVTTTGQPLQRVYDPAAPYANGQGMIAAPADTGVTDAVNLIIARQSYAANMSTLTISDRMTKALLDSLA